LADAQFITDCNARLALETEGRQLDLNRLTNGVHAALNDPAKGIYFIAECLGAPAGQLLITCEWSDWRNGNFWWIQSVYVTEKFRGNGIFRALFEHVRDLARSRKDVCGLRLYMENGNARARQAYERIGMKPCRYEMFEMDFVLNHD
jgi:GNAT superfamily N-acetyltransferase